MTHACVTALRPVGYDLIERHAPVAIPSPMPTGLSRTRRLVTAGYGIEPCDLPSFDPADPEASRVDPRRWFGEPGRRLEIEIGSGKGTLLVREAADRPLVNFLGIEQAGAFYRYAADRVRRHGLDNARLLHADAVDFLRFRCPDAIAAVVHLYFSDPWPKKRHHKRRVVQDRGLAEIHRVLTRGGELRLVTDHGDLWAWYEDHAERHRHLFERRPFRGGDGELVGTNYERKFAREGRPFFAMTLRKPG